MNYHAKYLKYKVKFLYLRNNFEKLKDETKNPLSEINTHSSLRDKNLKQKGGSFELQPIRKDNTITFSTMKWVGDTLIPVKKTIIEYGDDKLMTVLVTKTQIYSDDGTTFIETAITILDDDSEITRETHGKVDDTGNQIIISSDLVSLKPSSVASSVLQPHQSVASSVLQPQHFIGIMRHGFRIDSIQAVLPNTGVNPIEFWDKNYNDRLSRPFDCPLDILKSRTLLTNEVCPRLKKYGFNVIVSSPFRRCWQTACIVANNLGITQIIIDYELSEDLNAIDIIRRKNNVPTSTKMKTFEERYGILSEEQIIKEISIFTQQQITVVFNLKNYHALSEIELKKRSILVIDKLHKKFNDNILVITHGDLVNRLCINFPEIHDIGMYTPLEGGFFIARIDKHSTIRDNFTAHQIDTMFRMDSL